MPKKKRSAVMSLPYRTQGTIIHYAFRAALKGIRMVELLDIVAAMKGDPYRILTKLRRGYGGKHQWELEEHDGWLKITNVTPYSQTPTGKQKTP